MTAQEADFADQVQARVSAFRGRARAEAREAGDYIHSFLTSRIGMALAALCLIAFGSQLVLEPSRLPPIKPLGLVEAGIAPAPDLALSDVVKLDDVDVTGAEIDAQAREARVAARPYLLQAWDGAKARFAWLVPALNMLGALLSAAVFIYAVKIQVRAARAEG